MQWQYIQSLRLMLLFSDQAHPFIRVHYTRSKAVHRLYLQGLLMTGATLLRPEELCPLQVPLRRFIVCSESGKQCIIVSQGDIFLEGSSSVLWATEFWKPPGNVVLFKKMLTYSMAYSWWRVGGQHLMAGGVSWAKGGNWFTNWNKVNWPL